MTFSDLFMFLIFIFIFYVKTFDKLENKCYSNICLKEIITFNITFRFPTTFGLSHDLAFKINICPPQLRFFLSVRIQYLPKKNHNRLLRRLLLTAPPK